MESLHNQEWAYLPKFSALDSTSGMRLVHLMSLWLESRVEVEIEVGGGGFQGFAGFPCGGGCARGFDGDSARSYFQWRVAFWPQTK